MTHLEKLRKSLEKTRLTQGSDDFTTPSYLHKILDEESRKEQLWKELYD